jgi:hypothetical protein
VGGGVMIQFAGKSHSRAARTSNEMRRLECVRTGHSVPYLPAGTRGTQQYSFMP